MLLLAVICFILAGISFLALTVFVIYLVREQRADDVEEPYWR